MAFDYLVKKIKEKKNPTVAGLDPKLEYIPRYILEENFRKYGKSLEGAANAIKDFNFGLIDSFSDLVPAIKPQAAYYEMYGYHGVKTLYDTIEYAHKKGMYVITDGKRNDIGATMTAYAAAHLGLTDVDGEKIAAFNADALTVNGYLGSDGIKPLLDVCKGTDKGIFVLVKTSNPSGSELQNQFTIDCTKIVPGELRNKEFNNKFIGEKTQSSYAQIVPREISEAIGQIPVKTVYNLMGEMCEEWGADNIGESGYSAVGAVVGATYPYELEELRAKLPHTFFLVPGYGAQGGGAEGVAKAFDENGLGAIINSSRGIMCAYKKENCDEHEFAEAARREVIRMKNDITSHINL